MLRSMTGFGRATAEAPFGQLAVEILTVNRRTLEMSVSLPKEWSRYEIEVRRWIAERINRGQVIVRVAVMPTAGSVGSLLPSGAMLKALRKEWEMRAKEAGLDAQVDLPFLMQTLPQAPGLPEGERELKACVEEALGKLVAMRDVEGKALAADLEGRLGVVEKGVSEIEKLGPGSIEKMRNRLREKLREFALEKSEEWVSREAAVYAEKVDIAEEVTRFGSHVKQMRALLRSKGESEGRKIEFLLQELGREVNTMGSKSADERISHLVVEVKSELERMREQAANVE